MHHRASLLTDAALFRVDDVLDPFDIVQHVTDGAGDVEGQSKDFRESMYVLILKEILNTVFPAEAYLFSEDELEAFNRFGQLSYEAKYLLLRLSLRKEGKWHSLSGLDASYHADLGPRLRGAMQELSGILPSPPEEEKKPRIIKTSQPKVIDLTLDDEDDEPDVPVQPSTLPLPTSDASTAVAVAVAGPLFAHGESSAELADLLQCLNKDQLKAVAIQLKIANVNKKNRDELVESLLDHASSQSTLQGRGPLKQLTLNFHMGKKKSQSDLLRQRVMKILVHAIKLEAEVLALLRRLQIVFFRATMYAADLFLPSILARAKRRNYASYKYERTLNIFPSREQFLDYEKALKMESEMDMLLDGYGTMYKPKSKSAQAHAKSISATPRQDAAARAKDLASEAWLRWDELLISAEEQGLTKADTYIARFHPGHVYTRILHNGCRALAILKDYQSEITALKALLEQMIWRKSKRGAWYERLALLYHQYGHRVTLDEEDAAKFVDLEDQHLHLARETVLKGLEDEHTHLVWRIALENRLSRLEKRLKLSKEERYEITPRLKNPRTVCFQGKRIWEKEDSPAGDANASWTGKSLWFGANGEKVSVEDLSVQWYAKKGFKAVHSEGRIVTSIFALLFWDVLFAPVQGAFETKFQNAPLDMFHDTFFQARKELIESRLAELEANKARTLLETVDDRERPRKTVCIGLRWDMFSKEDLCEVVDCLGGRALAVMCRILCEDYAGRTSGVPDLLAWNPRTGKAKFVEVKGPGDQLRDGQRLWIHCLLSAGVDVELCKVEEKEERDRAKSRSKSARADSDEDTAEESGAEEDEQLEDEDEEPASRPKGKKRPSDSAEATSESKRKKPRSQSIEL
ncbi:hypothetical protein EXIGLDRAFT_651295 [Exidia glandulosa HHB12029]|uniref:Fanconi-associated nuclease n=1 Tax=Exidia glandulosa HHB12029 TaxID=1314781 RepID=A0A166A447_EXIGL|nr:hypothetical protein EXIGLDRAFT_651295 [Exidia glandulosa HHB12029]